MNKKTYWFYIESYVHLFIKKDDLLVYNSITGGMLEYENNRELARFAGRLKSAKNLYVVKLSQKYLDTRTLITNFIHDIRINFMGDLLDTQVVPNAPFQVMPIFNLGKDINRMKNTSEASVGLEIKSYLKELSLHINNTCQLNCRRCRDAFKQFDFCRKGKTNTELAVRDIFHLLEEAKESSLHLINILGGNVFQYSSIDTLIELLNKVVVPKRYHFHYANTANSGKYIELMEPSLSNLYVLVDFPIDDLAFARSVELTNNALCASHFTFLIEKEEEIEAAKDIIKKYKLKSTSFRPYYNGENLSLFEKYVFLQNKEMIIGQHLSTREIFARGAINPIGFGKISIDAHGGVFAHFNFPRLGRLGTDSLYDMLCKEIGAGKSWRKARRNVTPCKSCLFCDLCPPLSNYEYVIGRNNLCHIGT